MSASPETIQILHVDDEPGFADMAGSFLEREDERISSTTATSVDDGLSQLGDAEFDCVVSDYDMPGKTGLDFLHQVREEHPNLPFILFTGKGSEEIASDAISAGATDYLQKETSTEQYELLANRIANAAERARSQRAERFLRELAEHTQHILYAFTPEWDDVLYVNSAYEDIWGPSAGGLEGGPTAFLEGVHPADREAVRKSMMRMSEGEAVELEFRVNPDEAYQRWVRARGKPIRDDSGEVVRLTGFVTDVTKRKELERELQKRTERLQEAQRVAGVGSWEWDAETDTVTWSAETYRIFGWDRTDSTTPTFDDWIAAVHPDDREKAGRMVEEAMATGSFPTFEHRIQQPDGGIKWVECRGDVTQVDGETTQITGTVLNITDRRET